MNKIEVKINNQTSILNIRDDADESVAAEIFKIREYRMVEETIKNAKSAILDIGAHAGFFTIYSRMLNPDVKIVTVEPEADNLLVLKKNLENNSIVNTQLIEGAVARDSGRRSLFLARDNHNHRLLPRNEKNIGAKQVVASWSLPEIMKKCIIKDIDLIKIDIEGGEYEVFEGIKDEDFLHIKSFIIEYHNSINNNFRDLEERLRENGYGVRVFPSKFDSKMGFIFAVNKKI